jgi:hypothetical protein
MTELLRLPLLFLLLVLLQLELPLLVLQVTAPILLLRSMQLSPRCGTHHAVLRRITARSTTGRGNRHHPLSLLLVIAFISLS